MGRIKVQCRLPTAQCRCTRCPRGGLVSWGEVRRYVVQRSRSIWLRLRFGPGWRSTPSTSYPCFRTSMYICYVTRIHKVKVSSFLTRFNQQIWIAISQLRLEIGIWHVNERFISFVLFSTALCKASGAYRSALHRLSKILGIHHLRKEQDWLATHEIYIDPLAPA